MLGIAIAIPCGPLGAQGPDETLIDRQAIEGGIIRFRRTLGLAQLPPGRYTVSITVEQGSQRATQARSIMTCRPETEAP